VVVSYLAKYHQAEIVETCHASIRTSAALPNAIGSQRG
jgi:hypothetical protein